MSLQQNGTEKTEEEEEEKEGGGGLCPPYIQQGNPVLTLIRSTKICLHFALIYGQHEYFICKERLLTELSCHTVFFSTCVCFKPHSENNHIHNIGTLINQNQPDML